MRRRQWNSGAWAIAIGIATAVGALNGEAGLHRAIEAALRLSPIGIEAQATPEGVRVELRI